MLEGAEWQNWNRVTDPWGDGTASVQSHAFHTRFWWLEAVSPTVVTYGGRGAE